MSACCDTKSFLSLTQVSQNNIILFESAGVAGANLPGAKRIIVALYCNCCS